MSLLRRSLWRCGDTLLMLHEFRTVKKELVTSVVLYTEYQSTDYGSSCPWRIATPATEEWQEAWVVRTMLLQEFRQENPNHHCATLSTVWHQYWLQPICDDAAVRMLDLGGMDTDPQVCLCCCCCLGMVSLPLLGNLWISSPGEQCEVLKLAILKYADLYCFYYKIVALHEHLGVLAIP